MISCSEEPVICSKNKLILEAISSFAKRWIQYFGNLLPNLQSVTISCSPKATKSQDSNFLKITN